MTFTVPRRLLIVTGLAVAAGAVALVIGLSSDSDSIALASVIVAGLVGVVSPVVIAASAASRQRTELAAANERLSLQLFHERLLRDIDETRDLLDEAVDQGEIALSALGSAQGCLRQSEFQEAEDQLDIATEALGVGGYKTRRLMLRVGRRDDLVRLVQAYTGELGATLKALHEAAGQDRAVDDAKWRDRMRRMGEAHAHVIDHATDTVGVQLGVESALAERGKADAAIEAGE